MMQSLQNRLLLGLLAGASIVLIALGAVVFVLIRSELLAQFDATLANEAEALAALVEVRDGHLQTEFGEHGVASPGAKPHPLSFQLWDHEGRLIEESGQLSFSSVPQFAATRESPEIRPTVLSHDRAGRMVGFTLVPYHHDEDEEHTTRPAAADREVRVTLVVARDTIELDGTLRRIGMLLAGVFAGAVVVLVVVAAPIVRASLRPLKETSARIESLDTGTLAQPLDPADAPREVRSVIECLNGLLHRLHDTFQRERAFSANVAHELRTPLTGLRSTIDVALSKPRESDDYRLALGQCLAICKQAQALTENLLVLARLDSGLCRPRRETVALSALLRKAWSPLANRAASRQLNVIWRLDSDAELFTDTALLSLVLRNLLDNAVSYSDAGGRIEVASYHSNGTADVTIQNTTSGLATDLPDHVFDRFWRADASRTANGQHAGLGLSLCREATRALGGDLTVDVRGATFAVQLRIHETKPRGGDQLPETAINGKARRPVEVNPTASE